MKTVDMLADLVLAVGCVVAMCLVINDLWVPSQKAIAVVALVGCGRVAAHIAKHNAGER